uniref:Myosin head n=1 Tax=Angiostrongylus cantonensis TaxID=6313 RepID=A0A158PAE5_ANGCA
MDYEDDPGWQYLRRSREQILEDESRPYDSKKNCWVPDPEEGYVDGVIKETKGEDVTVIVGQGNEKVFKKALIQEMNPPKFEKTEDMSNLTFLNDASVLHNLRARYSSMLIYTYSGLFCVVINPYKRLPIYTDSVARMYMGRRRTEMPPHLFAVSDEAYRNMLQYDENQSMLITGESGAGKTENTKKVISYFAAVGASQMEQLGSKKEGEKEVTLEDQIVQTNPVLEAFGNAKTVRNNNSSRFGKFIRIHFSKQGRVASCDIEHYLLEKSRVIRQAPGERCYHIFYQVFSGHVPTLTKDLLLNKPVKDYHFVAQAELKIDGVNDKEEHQLTDEAFDILKFSAEEKMNCYKLVSAMMHMGNMKFKQRPREEQAETDGTDEAERAAAMYGVEHEDFLKALMRPRVKVGSEWVNKGQNLEQVTWAVGAMAKGLYSRVFHWLVKKCNQTLDKKGIPRDHFIGVLDIAGFEIFDFNSFEQLWINFVNEKLQQFFNHHMFVLEQEEYAREGIQWTFIDFGLDLQACIELIEKPLGIISMLDEECIVPKASDTTLAQKLIEQHLGKHPNFEKPKPPKGKQSEAHFAMRHYAGTVRYNVTNWLEKNKDPLNDTVVQVMKNSKKNALLVEVWQDYTTQEEAAAATKGNSAAKKKGKSSSFMTVSMLYRESLNNLMCMLNKTHPHFIRCIIPNEKKQSGIIDASLVLNQLTCNGVLEGIRICRKGFPNRTLHPDFVQRYALLAADEALQGKEDPKKGASAMLARLVKEKKLTDENFRVGYTKVFFKAGIVAYLEDLRDTRLAQLITGFQAQIRWYYQMLEKKRLVKFIAAVKSIQRSIRNYVMLRTWSWFKLYGKVKPLIQSGKIEEQYEKLQESVATLKQTLLKEQSMKLQLSEDTEKIQKETAELLAQLEATKGSNTEIEERMAIMSEQNAALESKLAHAGARLDAGEAAAVELQMEKKRVESECFELKKHCQEIDMALRKSEAEKSSKEHQIRSLQDEMHHQDVAISKLHKERKNQEESNKKLNEDLHAAEENNMASNKLKAKLMQTLEESEATLEREKRNRADMDKLKRKTEGDLKIAQETIDELSKAKSDVENSLRRKETELHNVGMKLEDEKVAVAKLQKAIQIDEAKIKDLCDQLADEKEFRQRADRARSEQQLEYDELTDQLDNESRATAAEIELGKKKDMEVAKLRRDLEETGLKFEEQLSSLKKKGADTVQELSEQVEQLQKQKCRAEKEKAQMQREYDEASSALDQVAKARAEHERIAKQHEVRLLELRLRADEQSQQLQGFVSLKGRVMSENSDLARQVEELESKIQAATRLKLQFLNELDQSRQLAEEEGRERQNLNNLSKNLTRELEQLRESIEDEVAGKAESIRQLQKSQTELEQWRTKFETEGLIGADEFDEVKKRQNAKTSEIQDALDASNAKLVTLENARSRLTTEAEASRLEAERHAQIVASLEKKQKAFDKLIDEWKKKVDDLYLELDNAQRDSRQLSGEAHKLRGQHDALVDQVEGLKRENKALADQVHDLTDQLGESARAAHELSKNMRRLEMEKEELQRGLDEAEAALEAEESKSLRCQIEVTQIRSEIEKRIAEKEEEFENFRQVHQHTIDNLQANLESETKSKSELLRVKKKLEVDVNELEVALDHANRANEDAQKNVKRYVDQVRELQEVIDEEQRRREEFRELLLGSERKLAAAKQEQEELVVKLDATERARRVAEQAVREQQEQNNDLNSQNYGLAAQKSQLDNEFALLKSDIVEAQAELSASVERSRRAGADATKMAEELRQEQERSLKIERYKKQLESQVKEMQERADASEAAVVKGGAKAVQKAEAHLKTLQNNLEKEAHRAAEAVKSLSRADRRVRELEFQVAEDKKNYDKLQELVEKLSDKLRQQKRQLDEAEEQANNHLTKYRTVQMALETAEERADSAEHCLVRIRSRSRTSIEQK